MRALLIRCYPAAWRERYGDEFASILEERPLGPFDVADILLGALDARLRMRDRRADVTQRKGFNMTLRIGGIAAILGAAALGSAWFLGSGLFVDNGPVAGFLLVLGLGLLVLALAGLTSFQARTYPVTSWTAFALLTVGTVIAIVSFVGVAAEEDGYWELGIIGLLVGLAGTGLFAVVTYRSAALSRAGAVLLATGSGLPFLAVALNQPVFVAAAILFFLLGWFLVGVQAIRLDRPATDPRPA